ncbi:MAG: hypothetical protein ACM3RP_00185 [Chitinophagales bacterium]
MHTKQSSMHPTKQSPLRLILLAAALLPSLAGPPVLAASTQVLRVPTADVLPFGKVALEAALPAVGSLEKVEVGLPAGFQASLAIPGTGLDQGATLDVKYRPVEGTLLTPAIAAGATYNTAKKSVSPYAAVTKGILGAKVTLGAHLDELANGAAEPVFGALDLGLFGPLHVLAERDHGTTRLGASVSLLNTEVKAYVEGDRTMLVGRVTLPF